MLRRLHFDLWYLFRPPWDSGISPPELLHYIDTHRPGRAIDLGCGSGTNVVTLAKRGWQVTGVDFSPQAVRIARRKVRRADVAANVLVSDVAGSTDLYGPYDLALDIGCFHAVHDRRAYLGNLRAMLGAAGNWLLYGFLGSIGCRGRGLDATDLELIGSHGFRLLERTDGVDKGSRPSAWFLFEKVGTLG